MRRMRPPMSETRRSLAFALPTTRRRSISARSWSACGVCGQASARTISARRFRGLGVDVFLGQASFSGSRQVRVGDKTLEFAKACIATGSRAAIPLIPGLDQAGALTNETVFTLTELPRRLAVIGAGPIGVELAQSFARFGSEVTLIEGAAGILIREDRDAAEVVERSLQRDGVKTLLRSTASQVTVEGHERIVQVRSQKDGATSEVRVDRILVAAGRTPNVENLGLETAGRRVRQPERRGG